MKITFIGTSHGVPASDRYCQSILIESGDKLYLVDAGAPVIDWLLRNSYDPNRLRGAFVTHCHSDHMHGLVSLADLAGWYFKEMDFDIFLPEKNVGKLFAQYINACDGDNTVDNDRIRISYVDKGFEYDDGNIRVSAFPTEHMKQMGRPAFGYLIEAEGKKVYITGDLNHELIDYPEFTNHTPLDAMVIECAHFPAEKLIEKLQNTKAKKVMTVHVHPLKKYEILESYASKAPFEMIFPEDSDVIEI